MPPETNTQIPTTDPPQGQPVIMQPQLSPQIPQFQSVTPPKKFRIPTWVKVILLSGMLFFVLIGVGFSLLLLSSYHKDQALLKTGVTGQATVIAATDQEVSKGSSGGPNSSYIPPSYQTNITYKLLDVPGYQNQQFNSSVASSSDKATAFKGQTISVVYNPKNPAANELKSNLSSNSFVFAVIILAGTLLLFVAAIAAIFVAIRQAKKRVEIVDNLRSGSI